MGVGWRAPDSASPCRGKAAAAGHISTSTESACNVYDPDTSESMAATCLKRIEDVLTRNT